jgi:hypothetical protein
MTSPRYLSVVLLTNEPHTLVAAAAQSSRLVERNPVFFVYVIVAAHAHELD